MQLSVNSSIKALRQQQFVSCVCTEQGQRETLRKINEIQVHHRAYFYIFSATLVRVASQAALCEHRRELTVHEAGHSNSRQLPAAHGQVSYLFLSQGITSLVSGILSGRLSICQP